MADSRLDDQEGEPRLWGGLLTFASVMMTLVGAFHVLGGLVALLESGQGFSEGQEPVLPLSPGAFAALHMAFGVLLVLAAYALFWGKTWGRVVAVVVTLASAVTNLASLSVETGWYAVMLVVDILVIYAVMVHGAENQEY
jgi:hypothetical protein